MLNMDVVPKTLDEAHALLTAALQPIDHLAIKRSKSTSVHHTLGMWLRNNWSLWDHTMPLHRWFVTNLGIGHPDDMSGIMLERLWCFVKDVPYDMPTHVAFLRAHWMALGQDPAHPR